VEDRPRVQAAWPMVVGEGGGLKRCWCCGASEEEDDMFLGLAHDLFSASVGGVSDAKGVE
jgi:hypothetical protein